MGQLLPQGCGWGLWGSLAARAGVSGRGCLGPGEHSALPGKGAASAASALRLRPRLSLCLGRGLGSTEPSDPCGAAMGRRFFSSLLLLPTGLCSTGSSADVPRQCLAVLRIGRRVPGAIVAALI